MLGAGGHAKVLLEILLINGEKISGITCPELDKKGTLILETPVIGGDEEIFTHPPHSIRLVNGVGSVKSTGLRHEIFNRFKGLGYTFANVTHSAAVVSHYSEVGEGAQIMAGAIIQTGCVIGDNSIINTRASVDHDCRIGAHVHVAPGVTICGGVRVEDGAHIGTGATVIQGVRIGKNSVVGAGALVLRDVPEAVTVIGVPAKVV